MAGQTTAAPNLPPAPSFRLASRETKMATAVSEQELFNGLIATYRELNMKVRPLAEERLSLGRARHTVRHVILELRDDELRFSQALKSRLSGLAMVDVFAGDEDVEMAEIPSPDDTTVEVLSQFGTARESTLAMLKGMPPEAWDDRAFGNLTVRDAVEDLRTNDARHLEKIVGLLGSPAPSGA
jgi:hypothetical protein